jgi:hypothetical protein
MVQLQIRPVDIDIVFISYDEPNAEINYADLLTKFPLAKRIHGVKGSDQAHKAAANLADTEWFVTVDGDNIVDPKFFNIEIPLLENVSVYSWCGRNVINDLKYGNGGVKIWKKDFVLNMKTHESAESQSAQVDFCWENGYRNFPTVFSDTVINHTPYQAWRAGFREGVKMLLLQGTKVDKSQLKSQVYWHNLHRLRMWSCVGSHVDNGIYAILGARQGSYMAYCSDWDYLNVRDFDKLLELYNEIALPFENNTDACIEEIKKLGKQLRINLGLNWSYFDPEQSQYITEMYDEAIALGQTYYSGELPWKNIF